MSSQHVWYMDNYLNHYLHNYDSYQVASHFLFHVDRYLFFVQRIYVLQFVNWFFVFSLQNEWRKKSFEKLDFPVELKEFLKNFHWEEKKWFFL